MEDHTWQLQEAKNKFSEVVKKAQTNPQIVTKRGVKSVVVISFNQYDRLKRSSQRGRRPRKGLVEFFRESPLAALDEELDVERVSDVPREVEL